MSRVLALAIALAGCGAWGCVGPWSARDPGELAAAYVEAGRYREAAREIELAVRSHPRDPQLRQRAALIHAQNEDLERAIGHLEVALQLTPSDPEVWIALGRLESQRENAADAYVAYRRATELAPEEIRAVSGLALAADSLGFDAEAEDAYARWAELERLQEAETPPANQP